MAQGSRWKTWASGVAVGMAAWLIWLGTTWFVVATADGWPSSRAAWLDKAGWQLWLCVPCGAFFLWRVMRGASAGYLALGLVCGLAFPVLLLLSVLLMVGVPHA